jgi:hypothetical protein
MPDERRQPTEERIQDSVARVAMIERSILVLLVVGLLIGVLAVVKPFTTTILFGAALATAAWPMRQALVRRGLGHGPAAALCCCCRLLSSFYRRFFSRPIWPIKWFGHATCAGMFRGDTRAASLDQSRAALSAGVWAPPGIA